MILKRKLPMLKLTNLYIKNSIFILILGLCGCISTPDPNTPVYSPGPANSKDNLWWILHPTAIPQVEYYMLPDSPMSLYKEIQ